MALKLEIEEEDIITVSASIKKRERSCQGIVTLPKKIIDRHGLLNKDDVVLAFIKKVEKK